MFDSYQRTCPCGATLKDEKVRCRACHRFLPRRLSRLRRRIENTVFAVLVIAGTIAVVDPDLLRPLFEKPPPPGVASLGPEPWRGVGPEPSSWTWAHALAPQVEAVCQATFARYADQRSVIASLAQFLPHVHRETGEPLTQEALRFSAAEEKDALAVLGDESRFVGECLRWSYDAMRACEHHKSDLNRPAGSACMTNVVQTALVTAPLTTCSSAAAFHRVKRACALAASQASLASRPKG